MGWRDIGRRGVLWSLLALAAGATCAPGCAVSRSGMSPGQTDELRAALRSVYESVERGDEPEYRKLVTIPVGDAYSDALTATMFASVRLHQAVDQRIRNDPGVDPRARPTSRATSQHRPTTRVYASLAAVDYRDNARTILRAVEGWTFTLQGDRATIDQLASRPGAPTLRRSGKRWVLEPIPLDLPRGTASYRLAVDTERAMTKALDTARNAVTDGSAKSIEDVNTIIRDLLTEPTPPTTQP